MSNIDLEGDIDIDDDTDAWLVEASRRIEEPAGDVRRLIDAISSNLSRVRRPARALATDTSHVRVSDRIVQQLLATRIRNAVGRLVVFVAVDGDHDTVSGVRVGLIGRYHDDLLDVSDDVRDVVDDVLKTTLGADVTTRARRDIGVRWQDVYTREWLS